jgi:peptide deformylase
MNLVYYPDPILSREVSDVNLEAPGFDPVELKEQMVKLMLEKNGLGLSAPQVGLDYKLFVMGEKEDASVMVINPEIVDVSNETELDVEGCLSFPDMFVKLSRPKDVKAIWYNEKLERQEGLISGYGARCFLHEFDHLHGVVYKDKVSRLKWDRANKKKSKIEKKRSGLMNYLKLMSAAEAQQLQTEVAVAENIQE